MDIIEFLVSLISFFMLNIPVYAALNKYILKPSGRTARYIFTVIYWAAALFAQNLPAFAGILLLIYKVYGKSSEDGYLRERSEWEFHYGDVLFVVLLSAGFRFFIGVVNALYINILDSITRYELKPQEIVTDFTQAGILYKAALFFIIVVFAPLVEEYAFRYWLYDKKLLPRMPAVAAALISSGVFAAIHYNLGGVPSFFGLGLLNCYIYEKKGYYGSVLSHLIFNLVSVTALVVLP